MQEAALDNFTSNEDNPGIKALIHRYKKCIEIKGD